MPIELITPREIEAYINKSCLNHPRVVLIDEFLTYIYNNQTKFKFSREIKNLVKTLNEKSTEVKCSTIYRILKDEIKSTKNKVSLEEANQIINYLDNLNERIEESEKNDPPIIYPDFVKSKFLITRYSLDQIMKSAEFIKSETGILVNGQQILSMPLFTCVEEETEWGIEDLEYDKGELMYFLDKGIIGLTNIGIDTLDGVFDIESHLMGLPIMYAQQDNLRK